ncbi:MAG: hypothetical protein EHM28_10750 [Spirochaetaceae bacterium]|nr:MAG: hypothetical protein EHM28_10750 [Spirochaetaceae bacterium]
MNRTQTNKKNGKQVAGRNDKLEQASVQQNDLVRDIKQDAEEEAGRIVAEVEKALSQRREDLSRQVKTIRDEAASTASRQMEQMKKSSDSALAVERRKMRLKVRDNMLQEVIRAVEKRFADMVSQSQYTDVLAGWIVEAAIGLGCEKMTVNTSVPESLLVTDRLLSTAQKKVLELTGRTVSLKKSALPPLLGQGILLRDAAGQLAFNNGVHTRLLRYQSEIRAMIFDSLFAGENADF